MAAITMALLALAAITSFNYFNRIIIPFMVPNTFIVTNIIQVTHIDLLTFVIPFVDFSKVITHMVILTFVTYQDLLNTFVANLKVLHMIVIVIMASTYENYFI